MACLTEAQLQLWSAAQQRLLANPVDGFLRNSIAEATRRSGGAAGSDLSRARAFWELIVGAQAERTAWGMEGTGATNLDFDTFLAELQAQEAAEEELESSNSEEEDITSLERAHKDLVAVLKIIDTEKARLRERGGPHEMRLTVAEERIKRVMQRLSNVEGLVSVTAQQLFGERGAEIRRMSKSFRHFISSNFTEHNGLREASPATGSMASPVSNHLSPISDEGHHSLENNEGQEILKKLQTADGSLTRTEEGTEGGSSDAGSPRPRRGEVLPILTAEIEELRAAGSEEHYVFDALAVHERTGRRSMLVVAELLVVRNAEELGTKERVMRRFVCELHRRYEENPNAFHNEAHAAVVCHATHWLGMRGRALSGGVPWLRVATDIAALAHDVGHFGRNNAFCINTSQELALIYNDRSVLENMHAATCFKAMQAAGCNILLDCTRETHRHFREHVVDLILATDMANHFEFLAKFRVRAAQPEFSPQDNNEDRRLVTHCYLKSADLGHSALPWELHERWALRLLTEFYEQGDEERSLGVPVSPLCERSGNVSDFRESQKGFLNFVILPLFKELSVVTFQEVGQTCMSRIETNAEEWVQRDPSQELVQIVEAPIPQSKVGHMLHKPRVKGKKVHVVDEPESLTLPISRNTA